MPYSAEDTIAQRLSRLEEACRERGLKITPQRLEIFRELASTSEHPSAEAIYERIRHRMPTVSLDTIYRTLSTLTEEGLISKVEVFSDHSRFDANTDNHHHFVCVKCRKIIDFYWPRFDELKLPDEVRMLGLPHEQHAELRGVCSDCLNSELPPL